MPSNIDVLRANMRGMVRYAQEEFRSYRSSGDIILLQQAGEKLFNAVENLISVKRGVQVGSFFEAKNLAKGNKELTRLLYEAQSLHRFFYNGVNELNVEDAEALFRKVLAGIRRLS